jgi:D-alanine-D-alanine ligase-like ATP-grasp enzyme
MNSVYTTTITNEAKRRGIRIKVIDPVTPIFVLEHGGQSVRCYNALTDRVGAVTFHLAQHKRLANRFLRDRGFPVPDQILYTSMPQAQAFLEREGSVVVKPCTQWGGRGVSVAVSTPAELERAIRRARQFEEDVVIEECVQGIDERLIFVDFRFVASIRRCAARVTGNGRDTIRALVLRSNRAERRIDPSHQIPLDAETGRNLKALGLAWDSVPKAGASVQVRLTSNYHTGGSIEITTDTISRRLVRTAERAARLLNLPVVGIDFLVDPKTGRYWFIELSPDLAISPPEGEEVARRFLDYLFPETCGKAAVKASSASR